MAYKRWTKSKETLKPDARFGSILVSQFVNKIMRDGKKTVASRVFYDALDIIEKRIKDTPPIEVFEAAVNNVRPNVEVRSKRVGQAWYDYVDFHLNNLGCHFCRANMDDLKSQTETDPAKPSRDRIFHSTIGFLRRP